MTLQHGPTYAYVSSRASKAQDVSNVVCGGNASRCHTITSSETLAAAKVQVVAATRQSQRVMTTSSAQRPHRGPGSSWTTVDAGARPGSTFPSSCQLLRLGGRSHKQHSSLESESHLRANVPFHGFSSDICEMGKSRWESMNRGSQIGRDGSNERMKA